MIVVIMTMMTIIVIVIITMMSTQHGPPRTWCVPQQSDSTLLEALQLFEGEPCKNNGKNDDDNNDYGNNNKHNHLQPFKGMPRSQNLK